MLFFVGKALGGTYFLYIYALDKENWFISLRKDELKPFEYVLLIKSLSEFLKKKLDCEDEFTETLTFEGLI